MSYNFTRLSITLLDSLKLLKNYMRINSSIATSDHKKLELRISNLISMIFLLVSSPREKSGYLTQWELVLSWHLSISLTMDMELKLTYGQLEFFSSISFSESILLTSKEIRKQILKPSFQTSVEKVSNLVVNLKILRSMLLP